MKLQSPIGRFGSAHHGLLTVVTGLFAFVSCVQLAAAPANPAVEREVPAGKEIIRRLVSSHPRLLASQQDFERLQKDVGADPQLKSWHTALAKEAKNILGQAPSKYEIPDGLRLLSTSRRVMNRVYTLALCFRLEGRKEYLERAWRELEAAAEFPDWNPRHFLDTAEMTHAFAIAYDWLHQDWSSEQRAKLRNAMVEKGLTPALKIYRSRGGWPAAHHNWNQVCNGGIGMGALALGDEDPELSGEILRNAITSLPLAMREFGPDGAWAEGPGYWNYATAYNVVFLAACVAALGTDFGLSQIAGFRDTGFFPIYLTGPFGRTFNYADGGDRAIRAPQMLWLAKHFSLPAYALYEAKHAAPAAQDLLWYKPGADTDAGMTPTPLDKYFRNAEIVTMRSGWDDPKAFFAGFKAGDNKANHSHLDLGSFVFDALGARWAIDLGADDYNLPGYFGKQRWDYYRLRAEGQNTVLINPGKGPDQDPRAGTKIVRFAATPERSFAIADLTPAYKEHAKAVQRGVAMLNRDRLLVQDEIEAKAPAEVWWFMHTAAAIRIDESGRNATLQQAGVTLNVELSSPTNARFTIMDAVPLPTSPQPAKQAKNDGVRKLSIRLEKVEKTRISVTLAAKPDHSSRISPLADW